MVVYGICCRGLGLRWTRDRVVILGASTAAGLAHAWESPQRA